jgi:transcriptional regulator GlxA family with amidase domain
LEDNNWNIFLVAEKIRIIQARGGFPVQPHFSFDSHPDIDVLIVAGGVHTEEVKNSNVVSWVSQVASKSQRVLSVCTGAFILAEANLLNGLTVTTHREDIADLKADYPALDVVSNRRWASDGKYITSGGISAGIDMSLHLVSELANLDLAENTANQMEYQWQKCT